MKKTIFIIVVIIIAAGGILFISIRKTAPNNQSKLKEQIESKKQTTTESIATNAVTIKNQVFTPNQITVGKGTTVVWTNENAINHSVEGKGFESPILKKGESFNFTFNEAGTFEYICGIHPAMKGKVVVEDRLLE